MNRDVLSIISPVEQVVAICPKTTVANLSESSTVVVNGRSVLIGDYLARYPASEFVHTDSELARAERLRESIDRTTSLDFCLILLDSDYSLELKKKVAAELDELLSNRSNLDYVLDILLSQSLPKNIDLQSLKKSIQSVGKVSGLLDLLDEATDRVDFALQAWSSVCFHPMVKKQDLDVLRGRFIASGIWRRAVVDLWSQSLVEENEGELILSSSSIIDPRIVKAFLSDFKSHLPTGTASRPNEVPIVESVSDQGFVDQFHERRTPVARFNANAEQDRAVREVEAIARLFTDGKDEQAYEYLESLIDRQSSQLNHSYLVKSLCNIATQCVTGGRSDAASECLRRAAEYHNGVDARLFVQMGNLFKELRRFEEATNCFRRAMTLASGRNAHELIMREFARLKASQGNYREALDVLDQLSDAALSPETQTSRATILRKMGLWRSARKIYEAVWSQYETHQSFAGLAEVNRQTGRWNKAIRKYDWILNTLDVDERSRKIYLLAQSSLYKVSGNFPESKGILDSLYVKFSNDPSVELALAKVLRLQGETNRADYLFSKARDRMHFTEQLAARLYETALIPKSQDVNSRSPLKDVMPEYASLSFCDALLRKIISGHLDEIDLDSLPTSTDTYKLHSDFKSVLSYHARIALGVETNPKGDATVNRIRKRGVFELKSAVLALDRRDLTTATAMEQSMCLKIA